MRISDWSSDVCSSDLSAISRLLKLLPGHASGGADRAEYNRQTDFEIERIRDFLILHYHANARPEPLWQACRAMALPDSLAAKIALFAENGQIVREHEELFTEVGWLQVLRSEEHTSELQSLMRISYAVFCLKKKTHK